MSDSYVNALHTKTALVDDGVDCDGGLTSFTVTNDELALSTTNGDHGVDCLDSGLEWLMHWLATHDSRSLNFYTTNDAANDVALTVDGLAQRVDNTTQQCVANRNRQDASGCFYWLAFFNAIGISENYSTNGVFVEVQSETNGAVFKLEQFVYCAIGKTRHAGDTVAHFCNTTDGTSLE